MSEIKNLYSYRTGHSFGVPLAFSSFQSHSKIYVCDVQVMFKNWRCENVRKWGNKLCKLADVTEAISPKTSKNALRQRTFLHVWHNWISGLECFHLQVLASCLKRSIKAWYQNWKQTCANCCYADCVSVLKSTFLLQVLLFFLGKKKKWVLKSCLFNFGKAEFTMRWVSQPVNFFCN